MRRPRRASIAPRPEILETRCMLSGAGGLSDEVLAQFEPGTPVAVIAQDLAPIKGKILSTEPDGPSTIALGSGIGVNSAVSKLKNDPSVLYAQSNSTIHIASAPPNDPDFSQQWALSNPNGVDVDALSAWNVTTGSPSVIVAVIDSGIDTTSPEFAGRILSDSYNFINDTTNITDADGHGTHVAGIIAANQNNDYGVSGLAPSVELMVLKFIDSQGNGSTSDAVSAIYYAVQHGAKVINASWGGDDESPALDAAIAYANSNNVVFVTAAGNDGTDNDTDPVGNYPALDRTPNQISVAAVDQNGNLASFSNYGATTVDLAAPGVDILSTVPKSVSTNGLTSYSGTSMSTAFVTATVALVASLHPDWTAQQLVAQVVDNTKPLPSLAGKTVSGGMVDAYDALTGSSTTTSQPAPTPTPTSTPTITTPLDDQVRATIDSYPEFYDDQGGTPAGYVEGLYEHYLGRPADPGGLALFTGDLANGESTLQVASTIAGSLEAEEYKVATWFTTDLNRQGPAISLESMPIVQQWGSEIADGTLTDDLVHSMILGSPEFNDDHGGNLAWDLSTLYEDVLDRSPDPGGAALFYNELESGISLQQVASTMLASTEGVQEKVATFYIEDLGRTTPLAQLEAEPDVNYWVTILQEQSD